MSRRTERVASTIQAELAQIILRELTDPRLVAMASITRVRVSADLSIADVYLTIMGTPAQQTLTLNALKHSAGLLRMKLTKAMSLRVAPYLKFHIDENLKKEIEMMELLRKVAEENAEIDRKRLEAAGGTASAADASPESPAASSDAGSPDATSHDAGSPDGSTDAPPAGEASPPGSGG